MVDIINHIDANIIFGVILIIILIIFELSEEKYNQRFYDIENISGYLTNIHSIRSKILKEAGKINKNKIEQFKYYNDKYPDWKIIPFYTSNKWVYDNCKICPTIYKFLKNIPNLRLASLSKLKKGIKTLPYKDHRKYSNNVIRCHYGIMIPDSCSITVNDVRNNKKITETKYYYNDKWLAFDNSKEHYTANLSKYDRIILVVDVEKPLNIESAD